MSIIKHYTIKCDYCTCTLNIGKLFTFKTIEEAENIIKEENIISYKDKHFCGEKCKKLYIEKVENRKSNWLSSLLYYM